jgi:hypothetical protein
MGNLYWAMNRSSVVDPDPQGSETFVGSGYGSVIRGFGSETGL